MCILVCEYIYILNKCGPDVREVYENIVTEVDIATNVDILV